MDLINLILSVILQIFIKSDKFHFYESSTSSEVENNQNQREISKYALISILYKQVRYGKDAYHDHNINDGLQWFDSNEHVITSMISQKWSTFMCSRISSNSENNEIY